MKKQFIIVLTAILLLNVHGCDTEKNKSDNNILHEIPFYKTNSEENNTSSKLSDSSEINKSDNQKSNISSQDDNESNSNKSSKSENAIENATENSQKSSKYSVFYGDWQIKNPIASGPISADINESEVTGKKITLSEKAACVGDATYTSPSYSVTTESKENLEKDYRMSLSDLGITKDSISKITVKDQNGTTRIVFLMKDDNTLIYCNDGVFFEVKKI